MADPTPTTTLVSSPRARLILFLGLAAAFVLTRIAFAAQSIYSWDSATFAIAAWDYDLSLQQPHPPGYPFFVLALRAAWTLTGRAESAFLLVNLAGGLLALWWIGRLARELYGERAGVLAATAFLVSPLSWFWGEVGETMIWACAVSAGFASLAWAARRGGMKSLAAAAAVVGLSGAVRIELPIVLFPVFLWAAFPWRRRPAALAVALASAAVGLLAWLLPVAQTVGGLGTYFGLLRDVFSSVTHAAGRSFVEEVGLNLDRVRLALLYGLGPLLIFAVVGLGRWLARRGRKERLTRALADERVQLLWLGTLGVLLFFTITHCHKTGYLLSAWPFVLAALGASMSSHRIWLPLVVFAGAVVQFVWIDAARLHRLDAFNTRVVRKMRSSHCETLLTLGSDVGFTWRHGVHYFPDRNVVAYDEVGRSPSWHVHRPHRRDRTQRKPPAITWTRCAIVVVSRSMPWLASRCAGRQGGDRIYRVESRAEGLPCLPLPRTPPPPRP